MAKILWRGGNTMALSWRIIRNQSNAMESQSIVKTRNNGEENSAAETKSVKRKAAIMGAGMRKSHDGAGGVKAESGEMAINEMWRRLIISIMKAYVALMWRHLRHVASMKAAIQPAKA
jgi:hypothetical protein